MGIRRRMEGGGMDFIQDNVSIQRIVYSRSLRSEQGVSQEGKMNVVNSYYKTFTLHFPCDTNPNPLTKEITPPPPKSKLTNVSS